MIRRILIDLDDVCNSFTMHILGRMGCDVGDFDYHRFPVECGYDIVAAYHKLGGRPLSKTQFWNSVTRRDWAGLPKSREFSWLMLNCETLVGRDNVCIATSPTIDPDSLAGKLEWIHKNCPKWLHRQFLVGPPKHFCARPDTLLIDDRDENCQKFREHGGKALLVPRPWNSLHGTDTESYLQSEFHFPNGNQNA